MSLQPTTPEEVQEVVPAHPRLLPRGGGSKSALSTPPKDVPSLDLSALSGVLEYEPAEFTFTALAGTSVAEIDSLLAEQGQYLPFDPLLARQGATLGGVVATGTAGPGRYGYGGVRDFLIGVRFVDGAGRLVRGGGKVVKNSAGFDLPKLMVGSLGRLGVLVELTFKVFPRPEAYSTLQVEYSNFQQALEAVRHLTSASLDLTALDMEPSGKVWIRLGGLAEALPARLERLQKFLTTLEDASSPAKPKAIEVIQDTAETTLWQRVQEFEWAPEGWGTVKVPLTPKRIPELEERLDGHEAERRYSVGGNVAWVAWPYPEEEANQNSATFNALDSILTRLNLAGLVILGPPGRTFLGLQPGAALIRRIKQALDPDNRFLEV